MKNIIRVGDKFINPNSGIIEKVVGTYPGGKIDMMNEVDCIFTNRWHKSVIKWERIKNE